MRVRLQEKTLLLFSESSEFNQESVASCSAATDFVAADGPPPSD